jgi:hypothetical protein
MKFSTGSFLFVTSAAVRFGFGESFVQIHRATGTTTTSALSALKPPMSLPEMMKDGNTAHAYDDHVQKTYG